MSFCPLCLFAVVFLFHLACMSLLWIESKCKYHPKKHFYVFLQHLKKKKIKVIIFKQGLNIWLCVNAAAKTVMFNIEHQKAAFCNFCYL